ncbi:HxlR family transcriptional regulator [Mesorhizobium sp. L-8-10]|uniref:winged helix-turn-helix transcriptional regulator n=1 Tax=unclassified Mesorhizobium TaxID=325217 RepID=UPI0019292A05|nr:MULTISPECIES: helix-turn-helix domain-containing protein [unclassified Mesorhizobium]BCH23763.1 HxlR family transcriptional regulator [Mesorhizobium sp. L-8-3]BCH31491.1 HxlR family transcriptional regulator [Mesorhizobium sp. L-8-10]
MIPRHPHRSEDCRAVSEILQRVGDKWTVLVVGKLGDGPMRFNELRQAVGGISQKMLTTTLRGLERDGFVTRTVFPTIPPRVDYELTDLGRELLVPVNALGEWARQNTARVNEARRRFDEVHTPQPSHAA